MSRADMYALSTDLWFQHRVQASVAGSAVVIATAEGSSVADHDRRVDLAYAILSPNNMLPGYALAFANAVATDATVINMATSSGTVSLSTLVSSALAAQAALVTDAQIDTVVAAYWTVFTHK